MAPCQMAVKRLHDVGDMQRRLGGNLVEKGVAQKARQHHGIDTAVGKTPDHVENVDLAPILGRAGIAGTCLLAERMLFKKDIRLFQPASCRQGLDQFEEHVCGTQRSQTADDPEVAFHRFPIHRTTP